MTHFDAKYEASQQEEESSLDYLEACVYKSLIELCGRESQTKEWTNVLRAHSRAGRVKLLWDVEFRAATTHFSRYQRNGSLEIESDMGIRRTVYSAQELGHLLLHNVELKIQCRIHCSESGFLRVFTESRQKRLRQAGRLPCLLCEHWPKGEQGLWWHLQQQHGSTHANACFVQRSVSSSIVPYQEKPNSLPVMRTDDSPQTGAAYDPLDCIKHGDKAGLQEAIESGRFDPATYMDSRGSSALLWAAGQGHVDIMRCLIERGCDPFFQQRGKRAFAGRTALHWAARNGHLEAVIFLVDECRVNVDAKTVDGTTAFCWAAWQGHHDVMQFLQTRNCDCSSSNSFGCNAALWAAQGCGDPALLNWLTSVGCSVYRVNENGHGVLHKAAQRGQSGLCEWFIRQLETGNDISHVLELIGPDKEGCMPSDLAGMEGHQDLAIYLADQERSLVLQMSLSSVMRPRWLQVPESLTIREHPSLWEAWAGVSRLRSVLQS